MSSISFRPKRAGSVPGKEEAEEHPRKINSSRVKRKRDTKDRTDLSLRKGDLHIDDSI